jgi:hypothetical protein
MASRESLIVISMLHRRFRSTLTVHHQIYVFVDSCRSYTLNLLAVVHALHSIALLHPVFLIWIRIGKDSELLARSGSKSEMGNSFSVEVSREPYIVSN